MLLFLKFRTICLNILLHTKMWWHWIYRFLTLFLETENSINSHNLISLIRQVLDFAPVKVSLKLHFSCVHLMKGNQKIANFYEKKKVNPFSKVFNRKFLFCRKVLFCHIPVAFFPFFITVAGLTDTCQLKYLNFNGNTLFCFHDTARLVTLFSCEFDS